ncbi:MAG: ABC transporter ATP-binding protein, partial [Lachnospiraceae bacterium]|nr:ABC transporter ATP-binding protein [Lachnospiraceae bacterium]
MIRTLAGHIKEYKRDSLLTPVFMIAEVVVDMIIPYLMASIIDNGIDKGDMGHILKIGGLMLVMAAFGLASGMLGGALSARASAGLAKNLRKAMFRNIQTYSFSNIDRFSTASLVTRLTTDVTNIQNAYQMILRMMIRAPFSLIIAMIMAYTISARLANIYLIAICILAVIIVI